MAVIGEATVETKVDLAGLDEGMGAAQGEAEGGLKNMAGMVTGILGGVVFAAVGAVAGAVAGIGTAAFSVASQFETANNKMRAQLGLTADEAAELGDVVAGVYRNKLGDSIEDVGASVSEVVRQLRDLGVTSEDEIQAVTEGALMMRDAFGLEVTESVAGVRALMDTFGVSSQEALDLITTGFMSVPAFAEDGLDTIGEYSNLFSEAGFSAEEMFYIMEAGAQSGVLGTDKIADSIKEMGIILNEGGEDVSAAFTQIGLDFEEIQGFVASGDETWADYFDNIVAGLQGIEDPIARSAAEVAIFGTMAEDLGTGFTDAFEITTETVNAFGEELEIVSLGGVQSLEDMAGATDSLSVQYNDLGSFVEGLKRRFEVGLAPIGEILLDLANQVMPIVEQAFAWFEETLLPVVTEVFETIGDVLDSFFSNLEEGMSPLDAFIEAIWDIAPPEVLDFLIDLRDNILPQFFAFFEENVQPIIDMVAQFVSWKDVLIVLAGAVMATVIPAVISLVASLAPILLAIGAVIAVVALLRNAWENNWGGIQDKVQAVMAVVVPFIQNAIATITNVIQTALANIQAWWAQNGDAVIARVQQAWTTIQNAFNAAVAFIQNLISTALGIIQNWWTQHGDSVMTIVNGFLTFIREDVTEVINNIRTIIQNALEWISDFWDAHGATIIGIVLDMWAAIKNEIDSALDFIGGIVDAFALLVEGDWRGFLQTLWDTVVDRFEAIKESISLATDGIRDVISGLIDDVISFFQNTDWGELGWRIINGILNGLINAQNMILDWLTNLATQIWQGIIGLFGGDSAPAGAEMALPGFGAAGFAGFGGGAVQSVATVNNFNLHVHSDRSAEDVMSDFYLMGALVP